jgi:hypothetical protein
LRWFRGPKACTGAERGQQGEEEIRMGQIVGATLTTHVPRLMIFDEAARRAYMGDRISTFYAALEQLYEERIAPLDFGTFLIVDTHWWTTLDYIVNAHERHQGIYTSDELPASGLTPRLIRGFRFTTGRLTRCIILIRTVISGFCP